MLAGGSGAHVLQHAPGVDSKVAIPLGWAETWREMVWEEFLILLASELPEDSA